MCPSTHNMDLIRSSCLMLVIKLKKKKKEVRVGALFTPSCALVITNSQVVRIFNLGRLCFLNTPACPGPR